MVQRLIHADGSHSIQGHALPGPRRARRVTRTLCRS